MYPGNSVFYESISITLDFVIIQTDFQKNQINMAHIFFFLTEGLIVMIGEIMFMKFGTLCYHVLLL